MRTTNNPKNVMIALRIPRDEREQAHKTAERLGVSLSELVRNLLKGATDETQTETHPTRR